MQFNKSGEANILVFENTESIKLRAIAIKQMEVSQNLKFVFSIRININLNRCVMKKIIFCIGAMLIAATGFSQNESLIDQGNENTADVNQMSTVDLYNFSDVYQRGENDADIDQIGRNSSIVEQRGNTNRTQVNQNGGDGLMAFGPAKIQKSIVHQQGKNNLTVVNQVGEGNDSFVDQLNNSEANGHKLGNRAVILQEGRNNKSTVDQDNDKNWARIIQNGKKNRSITIQTSYDLAVAIHPPPCFLQGNWVDQTGEANYSNVYQNGDNQGSFVTQSANSPFAGELWTNEAWLIQNGEMALSTIDQRDCEMVDANNFAEVYQTNTVGSLGGNRSIVMQKGANTANVSQVNGFPIN